MSPRILITRSRHQTSDLAAQLQALGAEPILIPTIELAPPTGYDLLDAAIRTLTDPNTPYPPDWLIFTSANAAEALHKRAQHHAQSLTRHPETRTAAIGPATARALTAIGLPPDLIPRQAVAEFLALALTPYIVPGQTRIFLIRAETARDLLPASLTAAGALVAIIPAYRTVVPRQSIPQLQDLLATPQNWPDAVTFTSSSTAINLFDLLNYMNCTLPAAILRASIGPVTSKTLRNLGSPPKPRSRGVQHRIPSSCTGHPLASDLRVALSPPLCTIGASLHDV